MVAVQAYFRNALPPGHYPYPFWHSDAKWGAYEKSNEVRFYFSSDGRITSAGRSSAGTDRARGAYAHVQPPAFTGQWLWTDADGVAQPSVTLFSDRYSSDNPNVAPLDAAYKKFALNLRNSDCVGCHAPDGHKKMHTLTLLQTPMHAASNIEEALREVRENKMPLDDNNDPKRLSAQAKSELLATGEAFQVLLQTADAWEREKGRARSRKVAAR
jgi:cytochrome c553